MSIDAKRSLQGNITAEQTLSGNVSQPMRLAGGLNVGKGDKGDSAYEVAVANGFEGTEEEWLESLKSPFTDEDKAKVDCLTKESIGHVDPVTGEITNKDEVIVYQSQTSRRVRGYNDEVNVDRPIWYNDADGDNVYDNSGINLHMKDPVIYNDALNSEMPRGKFLVKASAEQGNWAWVGIFKGHLEDEDLDGSVKAEVYCYLDAWQNSPYCPHEALHGREFDILSIYDGYSQIHGSYWFFPPCEYTLALFGDDSYNNLIEKVYFRVLDGAWRSRGYDDDFMYNPATKTLKVKNIECDNLSDAGGGGGGSLEPTGVEAGTYGGYDSSAPAYNIPNVEVDEYGRITNISESVLSSVSTYGGSDVPALITPKQYKQAKVQMGQYYIYGYNVSGAGFLWQTVSYSSPPSDLDISHGAPKIINTVIRVPFSDAEGGYVYYPVQSIDYVRTDSKGYTSLHHIILNLDEIKEFIAQQVDLNATTGTQYFYFYYFYISTGAVTSV